MNMKLIFIAAVITLVLLAVQYPLRRKNSYVVAAVSIVVKLVLAGMASMAAIGVNAELVWKLQYVLIAFNLACIADAITDLCLIIVYFIHKITGQKNRSGYRWIMNISGVCLFIYLAFGMFNYRNTVVSTYTVESKLVTEPCKVAFISDIHYGHPMGAGMLSEAVDMINAEEPDIVILGGDVTDDYTTKEQMKEAYSILSGIESDTYFIFGNHDRQPDAVFANGPQYTVDELVSTIEDSGIIILQDDVSKISDEIVLLGREDVTMEASRMPADELDFFIDRDKLVLMAAHSPFDTEDIVAMNADLTLSGHSHASQTFPNSPVFYFMGLLSHGVYDVEGRNTLVSSGAGTWAVPFRTEGNSEITVVRIIPSGE